MARLSVAEELDAAVRVAARDAEPGAGSRKVAEELYEARGDLVAHFSREWVIEKLAALVRAHRLRVRRDTDAQMLLGFAVPKRITLASGERIAFGDATLHKLRLYRAQVWKERRSYKHPQVARLDNAIALMEKYVSRDHPGLTYSEAVEKEMAERGEGRTR